MPFKANADMQLLAHGLSTLLAPAATTLFIVALGLMVETLSSRAAACPVRGVMFNLFYLVPLQLLHAASVPAVAGVAVAVTNRLGGGLIMLPSFGWRLAPAVAAYALAMNLGEYLFHRAQHRVPLLWAMHSLHHSDPAVNISTTQRHFWVEQAIKSVTIYMAVGLLFRSNTAIATLYGVLSLWNYFAHMNLRLGFGRVWFLLNSPQFHRVDHSARAEHYDRNFAALFPIFDAIFRSVHVPERSEFPPTGLDDGDSPRSLTEAVLWPARRWLRRTPRWLAAR